MPLSVCRERATPMPGQPADLTQSPQRCERWQNYTQSCRAGPKHWGSLPQEGTCPRSSWWNTLTLIFLLLLLRCIRTEAMKKQRCEEKTSHVLCTQSHLIEETVGERIKIQCLIYFRAQKWALIPTSGIRKMLAFSCRQCVCILNISNIYN